VLRAFGDAYPSTEVSVRELLLGSLEDVLEGRVDLAYTRLEPGQADLEIQVLAREPRLVALARSHRLPSRDGLCFADLQGERFVVNPAVSGDSAPSRWLAEQRRHGLPGRIAAESASVQEILTLVASGHGVCLVPSAVARQFPRAEVVYVPVVDAEPAVVSLAWPPAPLSPIAGAFLETAREVAARRQPR
jgi:DNA-binding transcriptional LysR family regulator